MSAAANRALVQRYLDEVWNQGNVDLLDELYVPGFSGGYGGVADLRAAITAYRASFPDLHLTLQDAVAEDDKIAYRWIARGTHQGEYDGIPPTGRPVDMTGITFLRVTDGRITEDYAETSVPSFHGQLEGA